MKEDAYKKAVTKAWKDPAFKAKLLKDPKAALEECGFNLPEETKVKCIEDKVGEYTFRLPATPYNIKSLSDAELSKITGADSFTCPPCM